MRLLLSIVMATTLICAMPSSSLALGGLEFLSKSPLSFFTPEDSQQFKQTLFDLLDQQPDGKTVTWHNPQTDHQGKMKAIRTFTQQASRCRRVKIFNQAGGTTGQGTFDFCQQANGKWKLSRSQQ